MLRFTEARPQDYVHSPVPFPRRDFALQCEADTSAFQKKLKLLLSGRSEISIQNRHPHPEQDEQGLSVQFPCSYWLANSFKSALERALCKVCHEKHLTGSCADG